MESDSRPIRKTCKRWDVPYDAHFLTFSCFRRQPFFSRPRTCKWFLESLVKTREKHPFDLWAYVIMPEHAHLLIYPHEETCISPLLKSLKLPVAQRAVYWLKEHAPESLALLEDRQPNGKISYRFWQRGGGYDRNLRSDRDVHEKIRYIHENPVRRGLADLPEEWPWSSAAAHMFGVKLPIAMNAESIPVVVD